MSTLRFILTAVVVVALTMLLIDQIPSLAWWWLLGEITLILVAMFVWKP